MINRLMEKKRQDEGFTLIELLIVIVILGILAAIVVFAVGGITDKGEKSACQSDYKNVEVAQEAHYAKTTPSEYADNVTALVTAKLLREAPPAKYGISTDDTGKVYTTKGESTVPTNANCPA